ncbi:cytochrome C oxidase assembly factor [Pyrobaculum aerophilum str. IM2]|uniref:Protoheme IX farnesyltransferase 1 n=1 Tax=Pyrobaculum aerophilum (strain ATCC 51768 / DSM 7523 / JCM 9630 / CIP 104966 / NBRC 100827 / IM2) TaxID=178306 RepID=COXX1_PYRAE|nr:heme o synthase [Pyrobaculum aerophilum]Q8ZXD4.1 RecName: Full=Protoheme IX farnesyltransferase 1; AltName: Full=Heme B farnesyltransferase 1; AltName: Full=Heme O synthase 1 [Pyrobaculum aerophilum str. IM2]AAL63414.1 cytochrome C oxidase assembly factor [Pyrobaculum aerophilum str. IM2]
MSSYISLLKPRVIWLLILASVAGYIYGGGGVDSRLFSLLAVAFLSTGGSAAFNHYWERDIDALMTRTFKRPLPSGLITPNAALAYSLALSATGISLGFLLLGLLPGLFVLLGWLFYAVVYTIVLKRRTWLNIFGGGFAGNAVFLGGYALAKGTVDLPAVLISFAIYLWIPSHIWALAFKYRGDYKRAGVPMLPALIKEERAVAVISAINAAAAAYILWLYLQFGGGAGGALVALGVAATIATSIYAAVKKTEEAMWKMYKASSPILALFLIALILSRL